MNNERVKNFLITATIIIAAIGLAVYSWIVLPDMVATQPASFSTGAPALPKVIAVAMPTVLMGMFAYLGPRDQKMYLGSLIGVILHVLLWSCN